MYKRDSKPERQWTLEETSRSIRALASACHEKKRRSSITAPAEDLLLKLWSFRKDPAGWYDDVQPLMQQLAALKEPHFCLEDEKELLEGIVADAKAFLERRPMENVPRLLRR